MTGRRVVFSVRADDYACDSVGRYAGVVRPCRLIAGHDGDHERLDPLTRKVITWRSDGTLTGWAGEVE